MGLDPRGRRATVVSFARPSNPASWPHDGGRESLWLEGGTLGVAAKQGIRPRIVERQVNKVEAIASARALFPRCQFDEASSLGLKRRRTYRKEWDDSRGVWKDRPRTTRPHMAPTRS